MTESVRSFLAKRRSVVANNLGEPGPTELELKEILQIGARVPDHKKLVPWRFILFQGEARARFGKILAETTRLHEPEASSVRLETEGNRFLRAPVIIAVISSFNNTKAVPEWEQTLSAGAVCQNLLIAAGGFGYSAQWLTEWYTYDPAIIEALGLADHERIAGFVYIGTAKEPPKERDRPDLEAITEVWKGD